MIFITNQDISGKCHQRNLIVKNVYELKKKKEVLEYNFRLILMMKSFFVWQPVKESGHFLSD